MGDWNEPLAIRLCDPPEHEYEPEPEPDWLDILVGLLTGRQLTLAGPKTRAARETLAREIAEIRAQGWIVALG